MAYNSKFTGAQIDALLDASETMRTSKEDTANKVASLDNPSDVTFPTSKAVVGLVYETASVKAFADEGKNLFNKDAVKNGYFINSSGVEQAASGYSISDYIKIEPNAQYVKTRNNVNTCTAFYDAGLNFISVVNTVTFTTPPNARYVRISQINTSLYNQQLERGSVSTNYVPYTSNASVDAKLIKLGVEKLQIKNGKNLFDKNAVTKGYYIDANGNINTNAQYYISDYIPFKGQNLYISGKGSENYLYIEFLDQNLNQIARQAGNINLCEYVDGYAYMRFSGAINKIDNNVQVECGSEATPYEPYTANKDWQELFDKIPIIEDKTNKMLIAEPYINLLNKDAVEDGKYLLDTGELATSSTYFVTDYIPAKPNTNYIGLYAGGNKGGAKGWCFFDANKKIISYYNSFCYCTTPEGTAYIRATGTASYKDDAMIVEGTEIPNTYYPYQLAVSSDYIPNEIAELAKKVDVVLPSKMYFLKGKQMILYFDNFLFKPHKRKIQCIMSADALGVSREDVFYGTPSSAGSGVITIKQVLENYKSFSDSLSYQIINPATKSGQTLNVMCVGDSFTDLGHYVSEIYHQLTDNGITCNLIGTSRGGISQNDTYRHEGLSGGMLNKFLRTNCGAAVIVDVTGMTDVINTTYGGTTYEDANGVKWSARGFKVDESGNGKLMLGIYKATTANTYAESINFPSAGTLTKLSGDGAATLSYTNKQIAYFNPFWNPSTNALDFSHYINLWGYNAPDLMVLQFTYNDVGEWAAIGDIELFISGIKSVADVFHTNYPSAKLVFSIEPQGSLLPSAFNIDAKHYGFMRFAKMLYNAIENDGNYNTWMRVAPSYAGVDRINGYMSKEVALCPRYPNILTKTTNGDTTHPNVNGMKQVADMIVPVIYSLL